MSTTQIFGIFGWPVAHSKSPAMHRAAIEALGLDAVYLPFAVRPEALADAVRGVRALGVRGVNVTLPHKQAVIPLLDAVDPDADAIGAVNTIVNDDGVLRGLNTDAPGLTRSLEEAGVSIVGRRVVVVGAGGASRAAVVGLARAGAATVTVLARRREAAAELCYGLSPSIAAPLSAGGLDREPTEAAFRACDLLVQGTSATLGGGTAAEAFAASLPMEALPLGAAVVDLVYAPRVTAVLRRASERGLTTVDGLGMLLHQGALALSCWTGREAPAEVMRRALEAATASSSGSSPVDTWGR